MSNEFRICNKCKGTNIKTLLLKLKEIDSEAKIIIGCQNLCGIGRNKSFVILNHIPIIAENESQLIIEVTKKIKQKRDFMN
ncbi:MAG: DUF1450 domain-containing protein [Bacilli bacterium]|nr:DUF1450 domain-containing protein [Bacilli bacterium]